jgi:hypothetical protein
MSEKIFNPMPTMHQHCFSKILCSLACRGPGTEYYFDIIGQYHVNAGSLYRWVFFSRTFIEPCFATTTIPAEAFKPTDQNVYVFQSPNPV